MYTYIYIYIHIYIYTINHSHHMFDAFVPSSSQFHIPCDCQHGNEIHPFKYSWFPRNFQLRAMFDNTKEYIETKYPDILKYPGFCSMSVIES